MLRDRDISWVSSHMFFFFFFFFFLILGYLNLEPYLYTYDTLTSYHNFSMTYDLGIHCLLRHVYPNT